MSTGKSARNSNARCAASAWVKIWRDFGNELPESSEACGNANENCALRSNASWVSGGKFVGRNVGETGCTTPLAAFTPLRNVWRTGTCASEGVTLVKINAKLSTHEISLSIIYILPDIPAYIIRIIDKVQNNKGLKVPKQHRSFYPFLYPKRFNYGTLTVISLAGIQRSCSVFTCTSYKIIKADSFTSVLSVTWQSL